MATAQEVLITEPAATLVAEFMRKGYDIEGIMCLKPGHGEPRMIPINPEREDQMITLDSSGQIQLPPLVSETLILLAEQGYEIRCIGLVKDPEHGIDAKRVKVHDTALKGNWAVEH